MTELKAQLLTDLPYHRIEPPRKENKYLRFFGSYVALPLMTVILIISLLILFLLVKTYFSNSYMYAMQDTLANKNNNKLDIGEIVDTSHDHFKNQPNNNNNIMNNPLLIVKKNGTSTSSNILRSLLQKKLR